LKESISSPASSDNYRDRRGQTAGGGGGGGATAGEISYEKEREVWSCSPVGAIDDDLNNFGGIFV
jgi:hypothetical protein